MTHVKESIIDWNTNTKNKSLTPKDFVPGSHKKVWWKCKKNHEWETQIKSRVGNKNRKGSNCPHCYKEKVNKLI